MFTGSMTALVTPFGNGKVDEAALRKLVDFQIQNGTSVLVPCGTTGESATLSHEEKEFVIRTVKDQAKGRAKILAGAGSNNTADAIKMHKVCCEIGVDGCLHVSPYYNKPTQAGLVAHFTAIAESSDLPIILYNVPGRTSVNILPETVIKLSKVKNIVGIKEASGSLTQATEIITNVSKDFVVLSGEDALNYPLFCLGAQGSISVTANVDPKRLAEQYASFVVGNHERARTLHQQLFTLHQVLFVETNPIPVKYALSLMGMIKEEYRLPLVPLSEQGKEKVKKVLTEHKII
jgi:4-hydroxy-tetrahydrodipicolinate synthase